VHGQLVKLGFLKFVDDVRKRDGLNAWLFPLVAPEKGRAGIGAYSKWFGRYLRAQGVSDTAKVFHSFRHSATDALRRGKVDHELREALLGHAQVPRLTTELNKCSPDGACPRCRMLCPESHTRDWTCRASGHSSS
jgi:integrase